MFSAHIRKILGLLIALALTAVITFSASAETITTTERVVVPFQEEFQGCLNGEVFEGEEILVEGEFLLIIHSTVDSTGGSHLTVRFVPSPIEGVGLETGAIYKVMFNGLVHEFVSTDRAPRNLTLLESFTLLGPAGTDNLLIRIEMHTTLNANGEFILEDLHGFFNCVG
jgi:hypothetical protein